MEAGLEKYSDLYDFAPVGYFSLDEQGRVLEVNLTGAALLGVERSRLVNRSFPSWVAPASRPVFHSFLEQLFSGAGRRVCEVLLLKEHAAAFWACLHGASAMCAGSPRQSCRVAVSDITALKQTEKARHRIEALALSNRKLRREIGQREVAEEFLRQSEKRFSRLYESMMDAFIIVDMAGRIQESNSVYRELLGYPEAHSAPG